jgi:hypothetical protein
MFVQDPNIISSVMKSKQLKGKAYKPWIRVSIDPATRP